MSDPIKHECGIALLRLKKPLEYYRETYGTSFYGLNKMYLLMEKQHNRGQDGAGLANIKFDPIPGTRYISRKRSVANQPIQDIFANINQRFNDLQDRDPEKLKDVAWLKANMPFTGELFLGHLRYGTYGKNQIEACHPFLRQNNWITRNLVVAGNFNLTNVDELFGLLVELGQHPKERSDTVTVLEKIGHFLDEEVEALYRKFKSEGHANHAATKYIAEALDVQHILQRSAQTWDGGYTMAGLFGHGDAFVLRDPNGIRPAYYYENDEVVVVTSERPPILTAFNATVDQVQELTPGHALVIKRNGKVSAMQVREQAPKLSCSFERIYFSRGNDPDIYRERIELGRSVCPQVLEDVDYDLEKTVFSFIPNTAETAFYGMVKGMEEFLNRRKGELIGALGPKPDSAEMQRILNLRPRVEKIAIKDVKLRTFITEDSSRDDLVGHVYDITHGTVQKGDTLVVIDDSIVRGTTLRQSILRILDRLSPEKIIIVSSAPQIRYPDCYGIDMAKLGDFIAFRAAVALLKDTGRDHILEEVLEKCRAQAELPKEAMINHVKEIYAPFTPVEVSAKIAELLCPPDLKAEVQIIYQTLEGLHKACPENRGDWYFSGDYPTPGGNRVVNRAFINFMEGKNVRAY